jgi:hypothetical protein
VAENWSGWVHRMALLGLVVVQTIVSTPNPTTSNCSIQTFTETIAEGSLESPKKLPGKTRKKPFNLA